MEPASTELRSIVTTRRIVSHTIQIGSVAHFVASRKPANVEPRRASCPLSAARDAAVPPAGLPAARAAPDLLHVRDTRFLLLMVAGYVLAMLGGVVLLHALSPVSHATMHPSETADVKVTGR